MGRVLNSWHPFPKLDSNQVFRLFVIRQQAIYQFVVYGHFSSFENFGSFLPLNRLHKIPDTLKFGPCCAEGARQSYAIFDSIRKSGVAVWRDRGICKTCRSSRSG
jgi:hypothetical protein